MAQLYHAFLDESGTHQGSDVVAVAGLVADVARWERFTQEWLETLQGWQLEYFHMTDFESCQAPYASWDDRLRRERLNTLLDIIFEYAQSSIGLMVPREPFERIISDKAKGKCGDAYGLAALFCFKELAEIAITGGYMLDVVMDKGAEGGGALLNIVRARKEDPEWMEQNRIMSLDFREKQIWPPLQAADIVAYEVYKMGLRQFAGDKHPARYPLKRLIRNPRQVPPLWRYVDDEKMREANELLSR